MGGPGSGRRRSGMGTGGHRNRGLRTTMSKKVNYSSPKFLAAQRKQARSGTLRLFGRKK